MGLFEGSGDRMVGKIAIFAAMFFIFSLSFSLALANGPACNDIEPITNFYSGNPSENITFSDSGGSDTSTQIAVPKDLNVYGASLDVTGLSVSSPTPTDPSDVIVVNDVSGSMVYNCGEDKIAQPGETPCKINDMKEATKSFVDVLLNYSDNNAGLVSYSTETVSWVELTNNKTLLFDEIDTYVAMSGTCISCAINKGIELLEESDKEIKSMILMTDGRTNTCTYGMCSSYQAEQQALNRAEYAWVYYNISIYTVAFGEDADTELMQQIADVSNGVYYYAAETDIVDVYNQIATDVTYVYPTNPAIDIGLDGVDDWSYPGELKTTEVFEFTSNLQSLVDCTCPGCIETGDNCIITLEVTSETAGMMILDWLNITGCLYEEIPPADHVVFSQVYYDTPGTKSNEYMYEWLEIYNPTEGSIDLSGMKIYDNKGPGGSYYIPDGTVLESEKYITIANDRDGFYELYGCYPDLDEFHRPLSNTGDLLTLTDGTGLNEIDFVAWEGEVAGWDIYANTNRSIMRIPVDQDTDTEMDWQNNTEAIPRCVREPPCYDNDEDGYLAEECGGDDCNDGNPEVNPGASELCNGIDDDCDGEVDEDWPELGSSCSVGIGECYAEGVYVCTPDGLDTECDAIPGEPAEEVCDNLDNDCDGYVDEDLSRECSNTNEHGTCYGTEICEAGEWVGCDAPTPAEEICDGIDNDCDGEIDESVKNTYYFDSDNDGYGDPGNLYEACWPPEGYITDNTDCDDSNPDVNPGAEEICNEIDDNCNGQIDEGCGVTPPGGGPISTSGLSCMQEWECTEWGECVNGVQTRTCTDRNNCPMDYLKPDETQTCEMAGEETGGEETPAIICVGGLRVCADDIVRECVENEWQDVETCQWGCEDGACKPKPEEVIEEEEGTPGGLVGLITGSPATFWGIIVIILIILGGAYWKLRK